MKKKKIHPKTRKEKRERERKGYQSRGSGGERSGQQSDKVPLPQGRETRVETPGIEVWKVVQRLEIMDAHTTATTTTRTQTHTHQPRTESGLKHDLVSNF